MLKHQSKLKIAKFILQECYWGNTNLTAENIVENINDKFFAKTIFNAVFQNSTFLIRDLAIFDEEMLKEFIMEKSNNLNDFNKTYLRQRIDNLITLYVDISYLPNKKRLEKRWN